MESLCNRAGRPGLPYADCGLASHNSSHRVGVGSVSAVCPRAGGISDRPSHEIIAFVVAAVVVVVFWCGCCARC